MVNIRQVNISGARFTMTNSGTISTAVLTAACLWGIAAGFLLTGWISFLADERDLARITGITAAVMVGPAAVAHIRLYAMRLSALIRLPEPPVPAPRDELRVL